MANTTTRHTGRRTRAPGAGYTREEFTAWLTASCERQGVPVTITDPHVISQVAVLLKADSRRR